jgi:uncharacterized membrane protein YwzB
MEKALEICDLTQIAGFCLGSAYYNRKQDKKIVANVFLVMGTITVVMICSKLMVDYLQKKKQERHYKASL